MSKQVFVGYDIAPVAENEVTKLVEACQTEAEAQALADQCGGFMYWSLYGASPSGPVECIGDFHSYDGAAEIYERITGRRAPQEAGRWDGLPASPVQELLARLVEVLPYAESRIETMLEACGEGMDEYTSSARDKFRRAVALAVELGAKPAAAIGGEVSFLAAVRGPLASG